MSPQQDYDIRLDDKYGSLSLIDIPAEIFRFFGHLKCGVYVHVTQGGVVREGDAVELV